MFEKILAKTDMLKVWEHMFEFCKEDFFKHRVRSLALLLGARVWKATRPAIRRQCVTAQSTPSPHPGLPWRA